MKNFSFVKNRYKIFIFTAIVIVAGLASLIIRGLNFDIDFIGGTELNYDVKTSLDAASVKAIEASVKEIVGDKFSSIRTAGDKNEQLIVRTKVLDSDESGSESREAIFNKIQETYPEVEQLSADNVSAEVSEDLKRSAYMSATIAVLLMLVYIAFRFQISSAFASVVCLVHDLFIMLAAYSVLQIPVNSTIIAAMLTILGYSINATIIIFDRIRENNKLLGRTANFGEKIDLSIKQTMRRSVNTTITTLFTIGLIYILGVTSIKDFALPLIVGIIAGLYSSVMLSGSLWYIFKKGKN